MSENSLAVCAPTTTLSQSFSVLPLFNLRYWAKLYQQIIQLIRVWLRSAAVPGCTWLRWVYLGWFCVMLLVSMKREREWWLRLHNALHVDKRHTTNSAAAAAAIGAYQTVRLQLIVWPVAHTRTSQQTQMPLRRSMNEVKRFVCVFSSVNWVWIWVCVC